MCKSMQTCNGEVRTCTVNVGGARETAYSLITLAYTTPRHSTQPTYGSGALAITLDRADGPHGAQPQATLRRQEQVQTPLALAHCTESPPGTFGAEAKGEHGRRRS